MSYDAVASRDTLLPAFVVKAAGRLLPALIIALAAGGGTARQAAGQSQPALARNHLPGRPLTPQAPQPLAGVERLRDWLTAVQRHEPGELDDPARAIGLWSRYELDAAMKDLEALLDRASGVLPRMLRSGEAATIKTGSGPLTLAAAKDLLGLTDDEIRRRDPTRIVKRGAVLHADLALFVALGRIGDYSRGTATVLVNDGRQVGSDTRCYHWDFGRSLLDAVKPDPGVDGMVRRWYHATSAFMTRRGDLAALERHTEHARRLLQTDAAAQFFSGVLHETFASPRIQAAIRGTQTEIGSAEAESRLAERLFRRAVALDPAFCEARLRLGHVLGAAGRHAEAAAELRAAASATDDPVLQYQASLFLGREEQALGHRDAARSAFERAASVYPRAESPYLALSQLARRYGDKAGARRALQPVLDLPDRESERKDPWWEYHISAGRHADFLLSELRKPFLGSLKQ